MPTYFLTTSHDTCVCMDAKTGDFIHAPASCGLPLAVLFVPVPGVGFLIGDGATGDALRIKGFRVVAGTSQNRCALLGLSESLFMSAEPLSATTLGTLPINVQNIGPSEEFSLVNADNGHGAQTQGVIGELVRLAADDPGLEAVLAEMQQDVSPETIIALSAYAQLLLSASDDVVRLLLAYPLAASRLAGADDPWMRFALPDLANWLQDRDNRPSHRRVGPELDWLAQLQLGHMPLGRVCNILARRAVVPRRKACILATARNEGVYLLEWIAYHRAMGFEHFFIYSNDNDDGSDALLDALAANGVITWIDNRMSSSLSPQFKSYNHAFNFLPEILDYEWCLIVDIDEFMVLDHNRFGTVQDYIAWSMRSLVDAIALNWVLFGTFGQDRFEPSSLLTTRFTTKYAVDNNHIKTMCRPNVAIQSSAHFPYASADRQFVFRDSDGDIFVSTREPSHSLNPIYNAAWINHYWSKSVDELLCKFSRNRGDMPNVSHRAPSVIVDEIWWRVLQPEQISSHLPDARITHCVPDLRQRVEELLVLPGVRAASDFVTERFVLKIQMLREAVAALDPTSISVEVLDALGLGQETHRLV